MHRLVDNQTVRRQRVFEHDTGQASIQHGGVEQRHARRSAAVTGDRAPIDVGRGGQHIHCANRIVHAQAQQRPADEECPHRQQVEAGTHN